MIYILSVLIESVSSAIFIIPAMIFLQLIIWKQRSLGKMVAVILFAFYLAALFSITGIPSVCYIRFEPSFNLIPLVDIVNDPLAYIKNTLLNMILFMPLGFSLPVMWKKCRSLKTIALFGFLLSLLIELLQIFTFRLTDIDDLITNTAGTIVGYGAALLFLQRFSAEFPPTGRKGHSLYEPIIITVVILLICFFLKPLVSDVLWDYVLVD